jgi:hypothetical protein
VDFLHKYAKNPDKWASLRKTPRAPQAAGIAAGLSGGRFEDPRYAHVPWA